MIEFFMNKWVAGSLAFLVVGLGSWLFIWSDLGRK